MEITSKSLARTLLGDRIMKVNHAGEHGAVNTYRGQVFMARLTARHMLNQLKECPSHEMQHREIFAVELERRNQARCRSYWLCGIGGLVLGLITGLLGAKAIAATTVAVESVVLRHLGHQLEILEGVDPHAVVAINAIIEEERQHHDQHAAYFSGGEFWPRVLTPVVSASTESVIWLGMRL